MFPTCSHGLFHRKKTTMKLNYWLFLVSKQNISNKTLCFFFLFQIENDLICDCRLSWLIELKNQTKNDELRQSLEDIECLLKKSKDSFQKTSKISHNAIERPPQDAEDETEYYDDEPDGKTCQLMKLKPSGLPCPEEASDPTELPLSRESIGFDMSWVKVVSSTSSTLRTSLCTLLLFGCMNILKLCWMIQNETNLNLFLF